MTFVPSCTATPSLTDRELEVGLHLVRGHSNPEIAAALQISSRTVQSHIANAMAKADARSRTHLAVLLLHTGMVPFDAASSGCRCCAS